MCNRRMKSTLFTLILLMLLTGVLNGCFSKQNTDTVSLPAGVFEIDGYTYYIVDYTVESDDGKTELPEGIQLTGGISQMAVQNASDPMYKHKFFKFSRTSDGGWFVWCENRFAYAAADVGEDNARHMGTQMLAAKATMSYEEFRNYISEG